MKTKIDKLLVQKMYLTSSDGQTVGELFLDNNEDINLKIGSDTCILQAKKSFVTLNNPMVNNEITLDISKDNNYILNISQNASPTTDTLKITLNTENGYPSKGEIILKTLTTNYERYNIVNAHYVNQLEGYSLGFGVDIISYLFDGTHLFVNIGNSYKTYVF